jgi:hypothetical protein
MDQKEGEIMDLSQAMDQMLTLDTLQAMGEAMAVAALSDELVFEFIPRAHRYMHENTLAVINQTPDTIEAMGTASKDVLIGTGKMVQYSGKGLQYTGKGIKYAMPSLLELLVGMV